MDYVLTSLQKIIHFERGFQSADLKGILKVAFYRILLSIVHLHFTILPEYFVNKVGECYLTSIVDRHCFSIIANEKSVHYPQ